MPKFILGYGYAADIAEFEAPDLNAAVAEARNRSTAVGVDPEALDDAAWAEAYSEDRAIELGLITLDDRDAARAAWKSAAPWR